MDFEWDDLKRKRNLQKHGLDFLLATKLFDGRAVVTAPSRRTEEDRFVTIGDLEGQIVAVVWLRRGRTIRLISARAARVSERRAYQTAIDDVG